MTYPIKAHTLPLLDKILATESLGDRVQAFIAELDKWNAKHPDGKTDGKKHENLHDYLVSAKANHPLYNFIYATLGKSHASDYPEKPYPREEVLTYIQGCQNKAEWDSVDFQPGMTDRYLMCMNTGTYKAADERIILNFKLQKDARAFVENFKEQATADSSVSFKILLATDPDKYNGNQKNDKIVIYYPKAKRGGILALANTIPDAQLAPQISGFYLKVKDGIGIAAETEPTWSFTMYTAEYCMKYLVNQNRDHKPYDAAKMYAYVIRRLIKNGRILVELADPADLPAAE